MKNCNMGLPTCDNPKHVDKRVTVECVRCRQDITISVGRHSTPLPADYVCMKCR